MALCAGTQKGLAGGRIVVYEADDQEQSSQRLIRRIGAAGILKRRFQNQERADCEPSGGVELAKTSMAEARSCGEVGWCVGTRVWDKIGGN